MEKYQDLKKIFDLLDNFQFDPELSKYKNKSLRKPGIIKGPYLTNQFILVFDITNKKIKQISDSIKNMMGYDPEKITLQFLYDQIVPEDRSIVIHATDYAVKVCKRHPEMKIKETSFSIDFRMKKSDGSIIWILRTSCIYKKDKSGIPILFLSSYYDITRYKENDNNVVYAEGPDKHLFKYLKKIQEKPIRSNFTKKEKEIANKTEEGKTPQLIADEMKIKLSTVYAHCKNMRNKSNQKKMNGVLAYAKKNGIIKK